MSSLASIKNGEASSSAGPWDESISQDFKTLSIYGSSKPDKYSSKCVVVPIVTSSNFMMRGAGSAWLEEGFDGSEEVFEYARHGNPTRNHLEDYFAELEGAKHAISFGSGVAALGALVLSLEKGDHIVASAALYGGSTTILREVSRYGMSVDFFHTTETSEIVSLIKPTTKVIYFETPSNPDLRILDIEAISKEAHRKNPSILVVVDNTFLTPIFQRSLSLGADMVLYSTSKYIGGHADVIGGIIVTNSEAAYKRIKRSQEIWGGIPSPFDCYLTIRSLKTLPLRMEQHQKNAFAIAKFLETHPKVLGVRHPGLKSHPQHELALRQQSGHSGMIGFYIKGGYEEAAKFLESVSLIKRAPSLGADISLVTIPAKMSHIALSPEERKTLGVTDNFIRLSVGLEGTADLIKDIDHALNLAVK